MGDKPLSIDLIEQGRFKADVEEALRNGSEFISVYIARHGANAAGATYTIHPVIKLRVQSDGRHVDILTRIEVRRPARPGEVTVGVPGLLPNERYAILVPASGSDSDPHQAKLFTEDGRALG